MVFWIVSDWTFFAAYIFWMDVSFPTFSVYIYTYLFVYVIIYVFVFV